MVRPAWAVTLGALLALTKPQLAFMSVLTAMVAYGAARPTAGVILALTTLTGTALAAEKLSRVLTNDPGMGVIRHADAGYELASQVAEERGVRVPMGESDGGVA